MGKGTPLMANRPKGSHPAARLEIGVPGTARRTPGPLGTGGTPYSTVHPQATAARYVVAAATPAATKPPPPTVTETTTIKKKKTGVADVDISVTILTDGANPEITGAKTSYDASGVTSGTPGWSGHRRKDGAVVVDTLTGPYELKGTITIQTVYGPGAKSTDTSLYGRGTTPKDLADGNTTLGFHESCHREDYLGYLKTKPLPVFTGKARMTESDYASAQTAFKNAVDKYLKDMETASHSKTDEVGYKKSECIKDGKCRS